MRGKPGETFAGLVVMAAPRHALEPAALVQALVRHRLEALPLAPGRGAALEAALLEALLGAESYGLRVGLFGCGSAVVAVLRAAAAAPGRVAAVVVCEGRPDLAGAGLAGVQAPTLLVVGSTPSGPLSPGRAAMRRLACERRLEVVPGGFDDPGALDALAELAAAWFVRHLAAPTRP